MSKEKGLRQGGESSLALGEAFAAELRANSRMVGNRLEVDHAWLRRWALKQVPVVLVEETKKNFFLKVLSVVNLPAAWRRLLTAREYGKLIESRMDRLDSSVSEIQELISAGEAGPADVPLLYAQVAAKYREDIARLGRVYRARREHPFAKQEDW